MIPSQGIEVGSIPITRSKCDRNAQKVTIINMESQLITLPVEKFKKFPEHYRVLKNSVDLLSADYRVLGIYLTGSFANGSPDQYSDLDVNLIVSVGDRESIIKEQETLREKVAKIATQFPATHLNNPYQIIVFYEGTYPIHVDYEYKTSEDLKPMAKGKDVIVVFDRTGELNSWKKACLGAAEEVTPTLDQLQYFEDRFWGWIIYTHGKIKRGELLTIDFGVRYKGYVSDMTRTVAVGEISPQLFRMYEAVRAAQERGCRKIKAGMTGKELDTVCRNSLVRRGYGKYFTHGTGHGIGMEVHELPVAAPGNFGRGVLPAGSVITCEPGVYIKGVGGVRIEDTLVLTKKGNANLAARVAKKLLILRC